MDEFENNKNYTLSCPHELFRYFICKNYKDIKISNKECDKLGEGFYEYIRSLNLTIEQRKNILPKNTFDVLLNTNHPLRMNGFKPTYILHFTQHVEQEKLK